MGLVHVDADVKGTRGTRTIHFLVDTGASFAMLPRSLADELGATMLPDPIDVSLADGTRRTLDVGAFTITLQGRTAPMVAFVIPDTEGVGPLLGVESLEALGLKVDPSTETIEPSRSRAVVLLGVRGR